MKKFTCKIIRCFCFWSTKCFDLNEEFKAPEKAFNPSKRTPSFWKKKEKNVLQWRIKKHPEFDLFFLSVLCVCSAEFVRAVLGHEAVSRMLTMNIMNIFIDQKWTFSSTRNELISSFSCLHTVLTNGANPCTNVVITFVCANLTYCCAYAAYLLFYVNFWCFSVVNCVVWYTVSAYFA